MPASNIFTNKKVVCPVCKKEAEMSYPNPRYYAAENREADQHITSYKWASGITTDVMPHHYAIFQCPFCYFSDLRDNVETPKHTLQDRYLHDTYRLATPDKKNVLERLRKLLSGDELNHAGAIALHLSAVWVISLVSKEEIDYMRLGRLYLRVAWLFREMSGNVQAEKNDQDRPADKVSKAVAETEKQFNALAEDLADLHAACLKCSQELNLPEGEANPYLTFPLALNDKLSDMRNLLSLLQRSHGQDQPGQFQALPSANLSQSPDFAQSLLALKPLWPDIPGTEFQCLRLAVDAYSRSIKGEGGDQSMEQIVNIIGLIVNLLTRLGDFTQALDFIAQLFKAGTNNKWELQRRLNDGKKSGKLNPYDEKMIIRKIATTTHSIEQAKIMQKNINDMIIARDKGKIERILKVNAEQPYEVQEKALLDAGFSGDIITILKDRQIMKEDKKKGWFGKKG